MSKSDPHRPERDRLALLVREALALSDALGSTMVGIHLDAARVELERTGPAARHPVDGSGGKTAG